GAPLLEAGPSVPAPDPGAGEDIGPWLGLGLLAGEGEQNFTGLHYDATEGSFRLRLPFEGFTRVQGRFSTPALAFTFGAPDPYAALDDYHALLRSEGKAAASPAAPAAWWSRPMFCGWGAQCEESGLRPGSRAPELARQDLYDRWLAWLEARDLTPGTVVLDDKWQATYGQNEPDPAKWPDLKGWIAGRHAAGQKVLLWWKAWDPEGLDPALCVTNSLGAPVSADPTSRAYEAALRASVRAMLGADGLNANGFKVDFTGRTPSGAHLRRAPDSDGTAWGLGLLHRLLFVLRDEAKRVKPDALVVTHTPNAAFGDVTDMIRLNDVNTGADVVAQMRHRARVARSALPETPIDTDNWPMPSRAAWRDYVNVQASLGVPALYFADRVCGEETTDEDVEAVRACWNAAERGGRP
ncbi:MAG TPA: hypothetical protein VHN99_02070, partial [Deinococcales bacterium]|nr:hypothetical protein [Deinococcales bacterium]